MWVHNLFVKGNVIVVISFRFNRGEVFKKMRVWKGVSRVFVNIRTAIDLIAVREVMTKCYLPLAG